jgi:hypothetical protein
VLKQVLVWVIAFASWPCIAAPVTSGNYGGFLIGVDQNGFLTGYFESFTGRGQFNCIFFVTGRGGTGAGRVDPCQNRRSEESLFL